MTDNTKPPAVVPVGPAPLRPCKNHPERESVPRRRVCGECDAARKAARRADPDYRAREAEYHAARRADPDYRARKSERDAEYHAARRADPDYRARLAAYHAARYADPDYRARLAAYHAARYARIKAAKKAENK